MSGVRVGRLALVLAVAGFVAVAFASAWGWAGVAASMPVAFVYGFTTGPWTRGIGE